MLYTEMTKKAILLAFTAHDGQTDKAGMPYILHPIHLAEQMTDENTTIASLLHDVVEDTEYTLEDLRAMGFPKEAMDAIALLTHDKSEPYLEYVWRIRANPIARAVKKADLEHNSDLGRLSTITEKDKKRILKYRMARAILEEHKREYNGEYRFAYPLDDERLYYLTVFYTINGAEEYSLDAERDNDVHIKFSAADASRIMALFPTAESLPEALAEFLRDHNEENFITLLSKNSIPYQSFHF